MNPTSPSSSSAYGILPIAYPARVSQLVALRTKAEVKSAFDITRAYAMQVPLKAANLLLSTVDDAIPRQEDANLQHLRRFAKPASLPEHLKKEFEAAVEHEQLCGRPTTATHDCSNVRLKSAVATSGTVSEGASVPVESSLYLLVCSVSAASLEKVLDILSSDVAFRQHNIKLHVHTISVPAQAPTSEQQAHEWSQVYWPTVYKKHNPNGPHPSIVSLAEDTLRPLASTWIALARSVATAAKTSSIGHCVGAIVVDRGLEGGPSVVSAAGDARLRGSSCLEDQGSGNVMAHAVMRVIGMVARKRREVLESKQDYAAEVDRFLDLPLTPEESAVYSQGALKPGGYLCTGLDIYLTHEPCMMCSMAILHSRFDRIVFANRMPRTGAMTAEASSGRGYGLFWLPELNWRLLAWQYIDESEEHDNLPLSDIHA